MGRASQAIYPSFIQLTCGGNIVKGVHDKKPISLTPWLALKTFWATDRETVKKQYMTREKRERKQNGGRRSCIFLEERINSFWLGSSVISSIGRLFEEVKKKSVKTGRLVKWWSTRKIRGGRRGTANTGKACQRIQNIQEPSCSCRGAEKEHHRVSVSKSTTKWKRHVKEKLPKKFPTWMMWYVMLFRQRPYMEAF